MRVPVIVDYTRSTPHYNIPDNFNPIFDGSELPEIKQCIGCKTKKPIAQFPKYGAKVRSRCKKCYNNGGKKRTRKRKS